MKVNYSCIDNDTIIQFKTLDDQIDEVRIRDPYYEDTWTVLSYEDLKRGIKKAEKKIKKVVDNV